MRRRVALAGCDILAAYPVLAAGAGDRVSADDEATVPVDLYVMPKRKWRDDEPAPPVVPYVIVSSRDGRGDPPEVAARSAAWRSVKRNAEKLGWTVTVTYALAWLGDRYFLNGNLAKAAHHVHSVALRLVRDGVRGVGVWFVESAAPEVPAAGWAFDFGRFRGGSAVSLNLTQFREALA